MRGRQKDDRPVQLEHCHSLNFRAHASAVQGKQAVHKGHLKGAEKTQSRKPKKFWEIPIGLGKVLVLESLAAFEN